MIFQKFVWQIKFELAVNKAKGQPRIIICANLVDLESPILYTKIQPQSFLGSGENFFTFFLSSMDMVAILFNGGTI